MKALFQFLNPAVAAFPAVMLFATVAGAEIGAEKLVDPVAPQLQLQEEASDKTARLLAELKEADAKGAARLEREIVNEWSKSGSAAMDLLLQRGLDALGDGETEEAIEHLTALTDHAPDFAEGWNARATAFFQARAFGPAVADLAQTLRLNPSHFGALTGLGAINEELERPARALQIYQAALAIHPHLGAVSAAVARLEAEIAGTDL